MWLENSAPLSSQEWFKAMRKHKVQILSGFGIFLPVGVLYYATWENDPIYHGKCLSQHLKTMDAVTIGFDILNALTCIELEREQHILSLTNALRLKARVGVNPE